MISAPSGFVEHSLQLVPACLFLHCYCLFMDSRLPSAVRTWTQKVDEKVNEISGHLSGRKFYFQTLCLQVNSHRAAMCHCSLLVPRDKKCCRGSERFAWFLVPVPACLYGFICSKLKGETVVYGKEYALYTQEPLLVCSLSVSDRDGQEMEAGAPEAAAHPKSSPCSHFSCGHLKLELGFLLW